MTPKPAPPGSFTAPTRIGIREGEGAPRRSDRRTKLAAYIEERAGGVMAPVDIDLRPLGRGLTLPAVSKRHRNGGRYVLSREQLADLEYVSGQEFRDTIFGLPFVVLPKNAVDDLAVIGRPPEDRTFNPGEPSAAPLIHPKARVEAYATIDAGMTKPTRVDEGAWIFKHAHIGHDAWIQSGAEIATGSIVGGHAVVECDAKVGIGVTILPYRKVGHHAVVGAGSVVVKDVPPGATVVGNPARILRDEERDPRPHSEREGFDELLERLSSQPIAAVPQSVFLPESGWVSRKRAGQLLRGKPRRRFWWAG